jgi:hypothetical protein
VRRFSRLGLTAETYGEPDMWHRLFEHAGYTGDYYWTILEVDPEWTVRNASRPQA